MRLHRVGPTALERMPPRAPWSAPSKTAMSLETYPATTTPTWRMHLADAVYVDTSAILALLISSDAAHARAGRAFDKLAAEQTSLLTSSYVLVETSALVGRRAGLAAVRQF